MVELPTVCVMGGGNGAFATASALKLMGAKVSLCEVPEWASSVKPVMAKGGIDLKVVVDIPGMRSGVAMLDRVGVNPEEALEDAELVFVVVPAFAQRRFAEFGAAHFRSNQVVALTPGNFGGSLEFASVLRDRGIKKPPILVDVESMIYSGFKDGPTSVQVSGFKQKLACAAFPATNTARALERLNQVYPNLYPAKNVLEIGLRKAGTVMHPTITTLNAGWIEKTQGGFRFYWDGLTPAVGRVMETLEAERLAIGRALDLQLIPHRDVLLLYYANQGAKGETLTEVASTNPVYEIDYAPRTLQHRFLLEDVPYGLIPMEQLAAMAGVPTPICSALINIASAMLERDLHQEARDFARLGLAGLSIEEIKKVVDETGYQV